MRHNICGIVLIMPSEETYIITQTTVMWTAVKDRKTMAKKLDGKTRS